MPSAIEQIVDTYVRLNNRRALEAMLMHRQRLAISIKGKVYDRSPVIEKIDEDIAGLHNRWSVRHGQGNGARKGASRRSARQRTRKRMLLSGSWRGQATERFNRRAMTLRCSGLCCWLCCRKSAAYCSWWGDQRNERALSGLWA